VTTPNKMNVLKIALRWTIPIFDYTTDSLVS